MALGKNAKHIFVWTFAVLTAYATGFVANHALAQTPLPDPGLYAAPTITTLTLPELLIPYPENKFADATPAQNKAIELLRKRPTTQTLNLVKVNFDALLKTAGARISVPNVASMSFFSKNADIRSASDFTWHGVLADVPGQATLVVRNGNMTGSIQDQNVLYRIEPVGNGTHALIKVDTTKFPHDHPPSFQDRQRRSEIQPAASLNADAMVGIDVMVPYTTAAKNAVPDIDATIQLAVAEANQSYLNSGIHIRLTLVDTFELPYSESNKAFETILSDFVSDPIVKKHRESSGADLSAMIINKGDYCGLASTVMADASTAFVIVYYDCATGHYSLAHEFGHLMGARHDSDTENTPFPYGHGYQHRSSVPAQRFSTIMAYECERHLCDRVQYWANPTVNYGGVPTGTTAINYDARVLNETAAAVAAFNRRPVGPAGATK